MESGEKKSGFRIKLWALGFMLFCSLECAGRWVLNMHFIVFKMLRILSILKNVCEFVVVS